MIQELTQKLSEEEKIVVQAVFEISPGTVDVNRSSCEEVKSFLICKVVSSDDSRCPFEFHFGRGGAQGRFNFFIGLGAEFHNYESFQDRQESLDLAKDVDQFLKSTIRCDRTVSRDGEVISERYSPDRFVVGGVQTQFWFRYRAWAWGRRTKEVISYRPWIESGG